MGKTAFSILKHFVSKLIQVPTYDLKTFNLLCKNRSLADYSVKNLYHSLVNLDFSTISKQF